MLDFFCPFCRQALTVPPDRVGRRVLCPSCRRPVLVSVPGSSEAELPQAPPATGHETMPASGPLPARVVGGITGRMPRPDLPPTELPSSGSVVLTPPASADLAAELSAVITSRMRPPPEPQGDLLIFTGTWVALASIACTLWIAGIVYDPETLPFVLLIGALMLCVGYVWVAYLAGQTDWTRGLLTLIPPITVARLSQSHAEFGRQPLWFAVGGIVLLALGLTGPATRIALQPMVMSLTNSHPLEPHSLASGPVAKLRAFRERRESDSLVVHLVELADPATMNDLPDSTKTEMVAELRSVLRDDERPRVRAATLGAIVTWSPETARASVMAALGSPDVTERKAAMELSHRFPDDEIAKAVATRFPDREERVAAKEALIRIGGKTAESAALPLLHVDNQFVVLDVCDVLEQVGGPRSVDALTVLSRTSDDLLIRTAVGQSAKVIAMRIVVSSESAP